MKPFAFYVILSCLFSFTAFSQEDNASESFDEDAFMKLFYKAEDHLSNDNYEEALLFLNDLLDMDTVNANINFKIGVCYLNIQSKETIAIPYFKKAMEHISTRYSGGDYTEIYAPVFTYYYLARALHCANKLSEAIDHYNAFKAYLTKKNSKTITEVNKQLEICYNAIKFMKEPVRVQRKTLIEPVNSKYDDYSPIVSEDGKMLIYTSRRKGSTGLQMNSTGKYYGDIYFTILQDNGKWDSPINISDNINSEKDELSYSISSDMKMLFFGKTNSEGTNLYYSTLKNDSWQTPLMLPEEINSKKNSENYICINPEKSILYFVSNRKGGIGGYDIYQCKKNAEGSWSNVTNLGNIINTSSDEASPYISPDGKNLYFSSEGHENMGGYDVFCSNLSEDGFWSTPKNLGYPINNTQDNISYYPTNDGKSFYYSSENKKSRTGIDIQKVSKKEELAVFTTLRGKLYDPVLFKAVDAMIKIIDTQKNEVVSYVSSDKATGNYDVSLPANNNYKMVIEKEDYITSVEEVNIEANQVNKEILKNIPIEKEVLSGEVNIKKSSYQEGDKIVLNNIYFEYDKASLSKKSIAELTKLIVLLKNVSSMKIEISGHTDNVGSTEYNTILSEKRAKTVLDYLSSHGIDISRLTHKGYGMSQPIETNSTEIGRQINRRTEFKIISI